MTALLVKTDDAHEIPVAAAAAAASEKVVIALQPKRAAIGAKALSMTKAVLERIIPPLVVLARTRPPTLER